MLFQPTTPIIIRIADAPTQETTVADVLIQAIGIAGVFVIAALLAGLLIGGILIVFKKIRPRNSFNGEASQGLGLHSHLR